MPPILAFDIETVPDVAGCRAAARARRRGARRRRRRRSPSSSAAPRPGSDFLPLHLHRVVAISCVLRERDACGSGRSARPATAKASSIQRFFDGIEKYTPQLVSWNGGGFDLPVLHYRGLIHGVRAPRYWDPGDDDRDFRYNNYISRYHTRHLDLMDVLALYQPRASAPLDELAQLAGLPGQARHGRLAGVGRLPRRASSPTIRNYCETDVANTYLLFLRFQRMRGALDGAAYDREMRSGARDRREARRAALARVPPPLAVTGDRMPVSARSNPSTGKGAASRAAPTARRCSSTARFPASGSSTPSTSGSPRTTPATLASHRCTISAARRRAALPVLRHLRRLRDRSTLDGARAGRRQAARRSRTRCGTSARCGRRRCCRRSTGRPGATGAARGCRRATWPRRAGRWSASASARSTYVADMTRVRGAAAAGVRADRTAARARRGAVDSRTAAADRGRGRRQRPRCWSSARPRAARGRGRNRGQGVRRRAPGAVLAAARRTETRARPSTRSMRRRSTTRCPSSTCASGSGRPTSRR